MGWLSGVSLCPVLFREQGSIKVWSCFCKWIMAWTKETSEDLRKRVAVAHQAGKGYKVISKKFGLHKSTVRLIVYKWRKFKTIVTHPRSGPPTKITPKARHVIVHGFAKDPRLTSKRPKAFLILPNVNIHKSIMRRTLNNHGVHHRVAQRKPVLSKKNIAARLQFDKDHVDKPEGYWRIFFLMDGWDQYRTFLV